VVAVPPAVVTAIGPVVAPLGTSADTSLSVLEVIVPSTPLKLTDRAPATPAPLIVTEVPTGPLKGEKLVSSGGGADVSISNVAISPVHETAALSVAE
jgi:hypothetical protein